MTGPMTLLVGLLLLSYLGSSAGRGAKFNFATSSGVEHVVLGLVLGPMLLGVIERSWAETFEPIVLVGAAWLGFVAGARWSADDLPSSLAASSRGLLFATLITALVGGVFAATFALAPHLLPATVPEQAYWLLGLLMTLPVATPLSIALFLKRSGTNQRTLVLATRAAQVVPFFPVLGAMLFFGMGSQWVNTRPLLWVLAGSVAAPVVVGALLGLVTAGLISRFVHAEQAWGVILGTTLLGAGLSSRLGLSAVATLFFIGLTLSMFPSIRPALKELTNATERPVLLPVALLLGATLRATVPWSILTLLALVFVLRTTFVLVAGWLAQLGRKEPGLGATFGFLLTMPAALPLALRSESSLQGTSDLHMPLLVLACVSLGVHELIGQLASRRLQNDPADPAVPEPSKQVVGAP